MQCVLVKESAVIIAQHQTKSSGQLVFKMPEFPDGFQQNIFKGHVREGVGHRVCDQLLHSSLIG